MKRAVFLTLASGIALAVGTFALGAPSMRLASKGITHREGTITVLASIVPNTRIHGLLACGFGYYAWAMPKLHQA